MERDKGKDSGTGWAYPWDRWWTGGISREAFWWEPVWNVMVGSEGWLEQ